MCPQGVQAPLHTGPISSATRNKAQGGFARSQTALVPDRNSLPATPSNPSSPHTQVFSETVLLYREYQELHKPFGVGGGLRGKCILLTDAEVLGMLHLHAEEFQVFGGLVLRERAN